jgi:hypothetical protein
MAEMSMSGKLEMFAAAEKNSPQGPKSPHGGNGSGGEGEGEGTASSEKIDEYGRNGLAVEGKYASSYAGYNHIDFDMKIDEILNIAVLYLILTPLLPFDSDLCLSLRAFPFPCIHSF